MFFPQRVCCDVVLAYEWCWLYVLSARENINMLPQMVFDTVDIRMYTYINILIHTYLYIYIYFLQIYIYIYIYQCSRKYLRVSFVPRFTPFGPFEPPIVPGVSWEELGRGVVYMGESCSAWVSSFVSDDFYSTLIYIYIYTTRESL